MSLRRLAASALVLMHLASGCVSGAVQSRPEAVEQLGEGGGGGDSASPRILALIARGQFTEAQVLIQESVKGGLMSQAAATALLARIQLLNTKLGELPARLQRGSNFPAVSQLRTAKQLFEEQERLMEKSR